MTRLVSLILLAVLLAEPGFAADFEASAGIATENTLRLGCSECTAAAFEATALFDDRHWDLSVGRIGAQDGWRVDPYWYVSGQRIMRLGEILPVDLYLGIGLMVRENVPGIEELLPQPWNFSLSAGLDAGPVRIELRHASNAGLQSPNRGQNWLLIGWRFGGRHD